MTPMNLLLEVGAHTNSREAAEDGAAFFADVVSFYFYGPEDEEGKIAAPPPGAPGQAPGQGPGRGPGGLTQVGEQAARANILWILGITAFIIVGFFILNAITWEDIKFKVAPWLEKVRYYSLQGDRLLEPYQAKIWEATPSLREGLFKIGTALEPYLEKIREVMMVTVHQLSKGDHYLEPVQEKIREVSLMIKERVIELYLSISDRRRLK
jgi:stage II sporulation protein P